MGVNAMLQQQQQQMNMGQAPGAPFQAKTAFASEKSQLSVANYTCRLLEGQAVVLKRAQKLIGDEKTCLYK
jgi:hypothetical protein